jgi:class 3 adenylate cyclase
MKLSIGAKIFGLALLLLTLNVVLAVFLLTRVIHVGNELRVIAEVDTQLGHTLSRLNDAGTRRRLAFDRWVRALRTTPADPRAAGAAQREDEADTLEVQRLLDRAGALLRQYPHRGLNVVALTKIEVLLQQLQKEYPEDNRRQLELIQLIRTGQTARTNEQLVLIEDVQRRRQSHREELEEMVDTLVIQKSKVLTTEQNKVFWLTISATVTLVALGLVIAKLLTQRMVQPVTELVLGIRNVEQGDLTVKLPVRTTDEIGTLTTAFNGFIGELRGKEELRRTFGHYVDPRILDQFILKPDSADVAGGRREMTVGFSDLVGFTALGEQLTPAGLVTLLNRHFSMQAEAIQQQRGVVDKFIGDAVMAFWGTPFTGEGEHAELACRAALLQLEAVTAFRRMLPELTGLRKNLPWIDVRIGLNTGEVIVGNIGSETTRSYTVIGDAVNLASRLEGANRHYGTNILVSEATRHHASGRVVTREIDALTVKGRAEPTRVFELLGLVDATSEALLKLRDTFEPALTAYRRQEWDRAEAGFRECLALVPTDGPSKLFLERIRRLRENPPTPDWNGVWQLETK